MISYIVQMKHQIVNTVFDLKTVGTEVTHVQKNKYSTVFLLNTVATPQPPRRGGTMRNRGCQPTA